MLRRKLTAALCLMFALCAHGAEAPYWPGRGAQWEQRSPQTLGMDSEKLDGAVAFAVAHEIAWSRDLRAQIEKDVAGEPFPEVLGETRERGGPAGMVLRYGYQVVRWGDV